MSRMTRTLIAVALIAALPITHVADADKTSGKDEAAVRTAIGLHFEGIKKGELKTLHKAWAVKQGRITYAYDEGGKKQLKTLPAEQMLKAWASRPASDTTGKILSVDLLKGQIAMAKIRLVWNGSTYDEYLTLFKHDGTWKITGKAFVAPPSKSPYAR